MPFTDSKVKAFNPFTPIESLSTDRQTGWFQFTDLARKVFVRRINATYSSPDEITFKVYVDGDDVNEVFSGAFRANVGDTGVILPVGSDDSTETLITSSTSLFKNGDWIQVDSEIMKIISAGSTTHTVQRGMRGTTAASHSSGSPIAWKNYPMDSIKIGNRAKYAQVQISTSSSTNPVEISRMEIEYE
jgi:hypothetical protein